MKRLFGIFMCISASVLLLSGCSNWYYCTLNSRGVSPSEKTYYIAPQDSAIKSSLEFKEYAEILKSHLNSSGYEEANYKTAALRIELGYGMGEAYLESTSTNTPALPFGNYNVTYTTTLGTGQSTTSISQIPANIGQSNTMYGSTSLSTTHTYKIPLYVVIRAFETLTNEPVWEVVVEDDLDRETQMQTVMPWLLLSAKDYFGRSSNGEQTPRIKNNYENREMYQLVWPY